MPRAKRQPEDKAAERSPTIADLQRDLALTRAERDEALAREAATADVLQVINSSPGDLGPVFEALLDRATSLCGAAFAILWTFDSVCFRAAAFLNVPPAYVEFLREPPPAGPETVLGRIAAGAGFVQISDMASHEILSLGSSLLRQAVELGGFRTVLGVSLRKDAALLGAITIYRQEVQPFTDKQIALLQNFAAQAVIAMENARLLTETREALEQQTATAEVLGVINSSPGDLAPVFDAILEKAHSLCGAEIGALLTYDGEAVRLAAERNLPPAWADVVRGPWVPRHDHPVTRIIRGERLFQIEDMAETARTSDDPVVQAAIELGGIRSLLLVPLRKDGAFLGYITAYRQEVRPFTDKQIALLENFAAQAVIAMENARLLTETREALERETATAEVLRVINSSPGDLAPVFDAILDKAMRLCEAAFGMMTTFDGERFHPVSWLGLPAALSQYFAEGGGPSGSSGMHAHLIGGAELVHVADMKEEEAYRSGYHTRRAFVDLGGARTGLAIALRKDGVLLGTFMLYRQEVRPFSDRQIALLQDFAAQAVIAMENARLITETRDALEQQTATAEVLGVINSSPGDLAPVFDAILEKALELCGGDFGYLQTYEGERFLPVAWRGLPPRFAEYMPRMDQPGPSTSYARILAGAPFVHVTDLQEGDAYRTSPLRRALIELGGARTSILIALRRDDTLLGTLVIYRQEVRAFSDKEIALLQNFAAQAVIAMENARLLNELRDRTRDLQESLEYQTATSDVLKVVSQSTFDLERVLQTVAETAARLCDSEMAFILRRDGEVYRAAAALGWSPEYRAYLEAHPIVPDRGTLTGRTVSECRAIQVPDVAADPDYTLTEAITLGKARTQLGVPLLREGSPIGVIILSRQRVQPFTEKQIELVTTFADQAVIAIENARLLGELHQRTDEVAELNRGLEARVAAQLDELGRVGRLKRFLAPQLAELIVSQGDEKILESHRREIVVVFCDLRGYTAFTETAEPEEVLDFLREYHGALGPLVSQFEGTLDQFSGDGIMVFFNDPVPIPDPAERAVKMAVAMREAASRLIAAWRERGRELGFGVGIAQGYATLGQIGFSERSGYTAIGTVCNVAARLCGEAKDGQILLTQRVNVALKGSLATEQVGALALKGLTQPVVAYNVPLTASQPALRVIDGGPPNN